MSGFLAPCRSSSRIGRDSAKRSEHKLIQPMDKLCDEKERVFSRVADLDPVILFRPGCSVINNATLVAEIA